MRFDGGRDPNGITVDWAQEWNPITNYVWAIQMYLDRAGWGGTWAVSTVTDGAVAVYVPNTSNYSLGEMVEAREIVGECEMTHLLSRSSERAE